MRRCLLDSSFVIDLLNELADRRAGPAVAWLKQNPRARLWISPVTLTEVLEGAVDREAVKTYLAKFAWQGIGHAQAEKAALRQGRGDRMGENDAWQAAVAECLDAAVVAHDPKAFGRLGKDYIDHRTR